MKKILVLVVLLNFAFAKAQSFSSIIVPNDTMLINGYIGKYPITMYIESKGFCEYEQEYRGWYKYNGRKESIPILFYYSNFPEGQSFKIYVKYDGDFKMEVSEDYACEVTLYDEVFETSAESGIFNGLKWKKANATDVLDVNFEGKPHDIFWELGTQQVYLTSNGNIILDLGVIDEYFAYAYNLDVIAHKRVADEFHLLIELSVPSKPGVNGRGMCGGGEEIYVLYLRLDENYKLLDTDNARVYSCFQEIPEDAFSYDVAFPENGINRN